MKDSWICCPACGKKLGRIKDGKLLLWCKGEKKEVEVDLIGEEARAKNCAR